jgi:mannosylglycoprotein endo-beta-mannosidase
VNESNGTIEIVNNTPQALVHYKARVTSYQVNGKVSAENVYKVDTSASTTMKVGELHVDSRISTLHFIKADLFDATGSIVSTNFYWRHISDDDFSGLEQLPTVRLDMHGRMTADGDEVQIKIKVKNSTAAIALMAHLQLRRAKSNERVLPVFYSDNYLNLTPGEERTVEIRAALSDLQGEEPLILVDGFNVEVVPSQDGIRFAQNANASPQTWPASRLVPANGTTEPSAGR